MQTAEERRSEDPSEPNLDAEDGIVREQPNDINEKRDAQNDGPAEIQLDDDEDPMKLPVWRKWTMTVLTTSTSLSVTFGSSVFSSAIGVMSNVFNVSEI